MKQIVRSLRWWLFFVVVAIFIFLQLSGFHTWFTLEWLHEQREIVCAIINNRPVYAAMMYIVFYAIAVLCALPLMSVMTITGGFLFGMVRGALYATIGATLGATLFFIVARFLVGDWVQERYHAELAHFNRYLDRFGIFYFLAVRSIAVIPFFVINLLAGLTRVPLKTFVWTTAVGIIPITVALSFAGTEIAAVQTVRDVFSPHIVLALGALALLGLMSMVVQYMLSKHSR